MRDILEHLEAGYEAAMKDRLLPDGKFICGCGKIADLDTAMPATNSPYAQPVCLDCWEQLLQEYKEGGGRGNSKIG